MQEVRTGNCRHTGWGPPDGLSKFLLICLNLHLILPGVNILVLLTVLGPFFNRFSDVKCAWSHVCGSKSDLSSCFFNRFSDVKCAWSHVCGSKSDLSS